MGNGVLVYDVDATYSLLPRFGIRRRFLRVLAAAFVIGLRGSIKITGILEFFFYND